MRGEQDENPTEPGRNGPFPFPATDHGARTCALDVNCQAEELDNLYAVDTSFITTSGAVNPTLTITANALRAGDHVLERLR